MPALPWIALFGVGFLTFRELDEVIDATTRLVIAGTVAGGVYISAKALKVI